MSLNSENRTCQQGGKKARHILRCVSHRGGNRPRSETVRSCFLSAAGVALAVTGLAKAFSAIGHARALDALDPIFGISFRHLLLSVGLIELFIAFLCLLTEKRELSLIVVAFLATNFLVYRIGLWLIGWDHPCGCLGNFTDALHLTPKTADGIMKVVLGFLLVGSYGVLFHLFAEKANQNLGEDRGRTQTVPRLTSDVSPSCSG